MSIEVDFPYKQSNAKEPTARELNLHWLIARWIGTPAVFICVFSFIYLPNYIWIAIVSFIVSLICEAWIQITRLRNWWHYKMHSPNRYM